MRLNWLMVGLFDRWRSLITKPFMTTLLMLCDRPFKDIPVDWMLVICKDEPVDSILVHCMDEPIILVLVNFYFI